MNSKHDLNIYAETNEDGNKNRCCSGENEEACCDKPESCCNAEERPERNDLKAFTSDFKAWTLRFMRPQGSPYKANLECHSFSEQKQICVGKE